MNKSAFDEIIKQNLIDRIGVDLFGYVINDKVYPSYYNNNVFSSFVYQMMNYYPLHYEKYSAGKGSELKPQNSTPPKMASVASSSRFCYIALRDCASVDFEHACPIKGIKGGTPPQMDAYIKESNTFIEVKCHEIFDEHTIKLSSQYYEMLFGDDNDFGFSSKPVNTGTVFEISRSQFCVNDEQQMVDIKQLICHLLGIGSHKNKDEPATLVYLFFIPKVYNEKEKAEIDSVFCELKKEIEAIFGNDNSPIKSFAIKNNIQLKAIAQFSEVMSPLNAENMIYLYS